MPSKPHSKYFPVIKTPMLPPGTFKGRTALITGGGTGLGKGIATVLSTLGASVAIFGRRQAVLETTAKELESKTGNRVVPYSADVRNPDAIKAAIDAVEKEIGLPTLVVNNAAGNFISPTERLSSNAWKTIVEIVLNGSAHVTLDMGKRLIAAQKGAAFLAITTTYTFHGSGFVAPSAAAKSGLETMMKSLASEWGRYGIRMNCIAPGPFETEGAFSRLDPTGAFMKEALERLPIGRTGEVEEVANLAAYLLSDYTSWMTGSTVVMDGGELPYGAGEFNKLTGVSKENWDEMEKIIRRQNAEQKEKDKNK